MFWSAAQVAQFHQDGYLIVDALLTADECAAYTAEIDELLAELRAEARAAGRDPEAALATGVFVGLSLRRESFRTLSEDPRLVDPLESLWGPDIGFLSDKVVFKDAEVGFGSPWHQDYAYWLGSHKISLWIALDDATEENGCLMLLPGSHRQEYRHDKVRDASTAGGFGNRLDPTKLGLERLPVTAPLPAGGAVFFHDLCLHASLPNRNGAPRRALIPTYRNLAEPDEDYPSLPAARRIRGTG